MPISYEKLLNIFKKKGITSYSITKKDKILGQATWKKIHENGHIDTRTIEALCKYLHCQPGDIMEYIPDLPDNSDNQ
jgi:putative transcriptional regulator